MKTRTFFVRN